jgi:oligopeptide transport system permease protein
MISSLFQRILGAIPTLLFLAVLTFFLLRLAPGGPFDSEQAWPPEIQANIARQYELDLPITQQFIHWLRDVARGDLKESFQYLGRSVSSIIADSLPISAFLGFSALVIALFFGILSGCLSAWNPNTIWDKLSHLIAVTGLSLPSYLLASLLILVFSLGLGWFPPALWEGPSTWVLPILTLCWRPMGIVSRLTTTSMREELQADYIRTARGKGLSPRSIIFKHALKNSILPVITVLGPLAANLITGSFIVEVAFQIPGIGKHFVQAVLNRDYPLVMGVTLTYGVILIGSNLAVDLLYSWADPRVRVGAGATES